MKLSPLRNPSPGGRRCPNGDGLTWVVAATLFLMSSVFSADAATVFTGRNTQPVSQSGSFAVTPGTGTFTVANPAGQAIAVVSTGAVTVSGSVNATQSGSYTVIPGSGTWNTTGSTVSINQPISVTPTGTVTVQNPAGQALAIVSTATFNVLVTNPSPLAVLSSQVTVPWVVAFTSGSFSNPIYTISTNTNVNGSTLAVTNVSGQSLNVLVTNGTPLGVSATQATSPWTVSFASGSFSNPIYTLSTNTIVSGSTVVANPGVGSIWNVSGSSLSMSNDRIGSGSIGALNGTVVANTGGAGAVTFTLTGAWSATLSIQGFDGTNWITIGGVIPLSSLTSFLTFNQSVNVPCGGFSAVRLIATAYTSGTAIVNWDAGAAPNSIQVYNNQMGNFLANVTGSTVSINEPVSIQNQDTIAPGVRASTGMTVQELKDTGRQVITSSAAAITGITTEALFTLTTSTAFTTGLSGTSFGVTSGKILRLQSLTYILRATGVGAVSGTMRLRAMSAGTCTATSPVVSELGGNTQVGSGTSFDHLPYPDGLELSGTQTFCISHVESATGSTVDVVLTGYQY